jgi:hypothetical protein
MFRYPMPRDLDPAANPDLIVVLDVAQESRQRVCTARSPQNPGAFIAVASSLQSAENQNSPEDLQIRVAWQEAAIRGFAGDHVPIREGAWTGLRSTDLTWIGVAFEDCRAQDDRCDDAGNSAVAVEGMFTDGADRNADLTPNRH